MHKLGCSWTFPGLVPGLPRCMPQGPPRRVRVGSPSLHTAGYSRAPSQDLRGARLNVPRPCHFALHSFEENQEAQPLSTLLSTYSIVFCPLLTTLLLGPIKLSLTKQWSTIFYCLGFCWHLHPCSLPLCSSRHIGEFLQCAHFPIKNQGSMLK